MTKKFGVYNANKGEYDFYDTQEKALEAFWVNVVATARSHYHNTAYTVISQNEDGSETWFNDNNQEIEKTKTAQEIKELIDKSRGKGLPLDKRMKVGVLP